MKDKRQPLQQMLLGKLHICLQKNETRSTFSINSMWIEDPDIRPETLKLIIGKKWEYPGSKRPRQCLAQ
jgi:hypothetical protein